VKGNKDELYGNRIMITVQSIIPYTKVSNTIGTAPIKINLINPSVSPVPISGITD